MSYSDDLVNVLKDDKDISTLKQSLHQSEAVCSQIDGDYNHLERSIEDLQKKIDICRQKVAASKPEIDMDEDIDLLQKELEEGLQRESLLKEECRVIACGINDLEQQSISIEESRQVLRKHDQDDLRTQMQLSMYASVTSIIPNLDDASNISGHIVDREKKKVEKFELDAIRQTSFETCNKIWKLISLD